MHPPLLWFQYTSKLAIGDTITFTEADDESNFSGCPGNNLTYSKGTEYEVAEIRGGFFRPNDYHTLWAPISATNFTGQKRTDRGDSSSLSNEWGQHDSYSSTLKENGRLFVKTGNNPDYSGCMGKLGSDSGTVTWTLKIRNFKSGTPLAHVGVCTPGVFDAEDKFFTSYSTKRKAYVYKYNGGVSSGGESIVDNDVRYRTGSVITIEYDADAGTVEFRTDGSHAGNCDVPVGSMFHPFCNLDDTGDEVELVSTTKGGASSDFSDPWSSSELGFNEQTAGSANGLEVGHVPALVRFLRANDALKWLNLGECRFYEDSKEDIEEAWAQVGRDPNSLELDISAIVREREERLRRERLERERLERERLAEERRQREAEEAEERAAAARRAREREYSSYSSSASSYGDSWDNMSAVGAGLRITTALFSGGLSEMFGSW